MDLHLQMAQVWILCHVHYMLEVAAVQTPESIAVVACAPDFETARAVVLVFENVEVLLFTVGGYVISLAFLLSVFTGMISIIESALLLLN